MITVSDVSDIKTALVSELPTGTVIAVNDVLYILGGNLVSRNELPEPLQNTRHRTALTGEFPGKQGIIRNSERVQVVNVKLECTHGL